jgi:hypothetical protein
MRSFMVSPISDTSPGLISQHAVGSYANIDGGRIAEALADLTGSVSFPLDLDPLSPLD